MTDVICGVDVSKNWLDAHLAPCGLARRFDNDAGGAAALAAFCAAHGAGLAVLEASGGYERLAWVTLWHGAIPTARINPRHARRFAEGMGLIEKTDRIDAAVLAAFARAKGAGLVVEPPARGTARRLETFAARLRQIVADITVNKQRLSVATDALARESLTGVIELLTREAKRFEGELASLVDDDPAWRRLDAAFREVKGVATRTVIALLSGLPEIGTLSGKQVAKLAGLAPIARDSGARKGRRRIRDGRAEVRRVLFIVAGIARKFHPGLAHMSERLTAAGKPKLVIRLALARKLLVILNAKARDARRQSIMTT